MRLIRCGALRSRRLTHDSLSFQSSPGQTPEFDEYTGVLRGSLWITAKSSVIELSGGQAVIAPAGEWVQ